MMESVSSPRPRAAGRVSVVHGERVSSALVELKSIRKLHPAIEQCNARLDLAHASLADLSGWDSLALDVLLRACPPWVLERGTASDRHYVLVAGGQFLPALRRLLPPDSQIHVVLVDSKFQHRRILHLAAAHAAAMAAAAACLSGDSVLKLVADSAEAGMPVLNTPTPRNVLGLDDDKAGR